MSMSNKEVTLCVLLDLSAGFDTTEHSIRLNMLQPDSGVVGTILNWFDSFLSGRKQLILVGDKTFEDFNQNCGAPHGSCMGPILFTVFVFHLFKIIPQTSIPSMFMMMTLRCTFLSDFALSIRILTMSLWLRSALLMFASGSLRIV